MFYCKKCVVIRLNFLVITFSKNRCKNNNKCRMKKNRIYLEASYLIVVVQCWRELCYSLYISSFYLSGGNEHDGDMLRTDGESFPQR